MATYYKWRRSTVSYTTQINGSVSSLAEGRYYIRASYRPSIVNGKFVWNTADDATVYELSWSGSQQTHRIPANAWFYAPAGSDGSTNIESTVVYKTTSETQFKGNADLVGFYITPSAQKFSATKTAGTFVDYIYNTSSSTYPNGGASGSYYYDQRTTVTSPTNPTQISYPSTINSLSTTITWQSSISNTSYPVSRYELSYSTNGGFSWQVAGTTEETTYQFGISSPEVTQIQFRVRAMDTNSQYSDYVTGSNSTVQYVPANPPVLVLPNNAKLGDTITISWNSVTDATNYILQRKVYGGDWTQIYSGANLSTTNLVDNLGISYRVAFNVGSNFTSEWSQEYKLNIYEKLIEMTYLGDDGNYMPLYPRTISSAVVNASDLINTVSLSGTYQGTGVKSNTVLLNVKEGIEPKIAFVSNTEGNVEVVNNFDSKGNLVVDNNNNVAGEEYSYVVIGKKED